MEEVERLRGAIGALREAQREALRVHHAERERHKEEMKSKEEETQQRERSLEMIMQLNQQNLIVHISQQ